MRSIIYLSATELWERFTYYAIAALLVLNLTARPEAGGFGFSDGDAVAAFGLYSAIVYLAALGGGALGDRFLGAVRAVWLGGALILAGDVVLALGKSIEVFSGGLMLVAAGTGLLKPNITALVARAAERDGLPVSSAFTNFYLGINIGGAAGPLLAAPLAHAYGWSAGYAVAAFGMAAGLVTFARISASLDQAPVRGRRPSAALVIAAIGAIALCAWALEVLPARVLVQAAGVMVVAASIAGFMYLQRAAGNAAERAGVLRLGVLFVGSALFFTAAMQAGAALTLFSARFVDRKLLGLEIPAATFQSLYPGLIVIFAPLFAIAWRQLSARGADPSPVFKFGAGMTIGGLGIATAAAGLLLGGSLISPGWLLAIYLCLAVGEILISPIGLGAATLYAPPTQVGFATGLFYLSLALGSLAAGSLGGIFDLGSRAGLVSTFSVVAAVLILAGAAFATLHRAIFKDALS